MHLCTSRYECPSWCTKKGTALVSRVLAFLSIIAYLGCSREGFKNLTLATADLRDKRLVHQYAWSLQCIALKKVQYSGVLAQVRMVAAVHCPEKGTVTAL